MPHEPRPSPASLQVSWYAGAPHVWAIDGRNPDGRPAVAHVVDLIRAVDQRFARFMASAATPARAPLPLPAPLGGKPIPVLRVPIAELAGISSRPGDSASVSWFADLVLLAHRVVDAARLRPRLEISGAVHDARWEPVIDDTVAAALDALAERAPPAALVDDVPSVFDSVVDAFARARLAAIGWRPPAPLRGRGPEYRAAQAVFRALRSATGSVLYRTEDMSALLELRRVLDAVNDRARGMPALTAQVRLHLPDEADDPWIVTLELANADDPTRWCTATDVRDSTPLALDVAGSEELVGRLAGRIDDTAQRLAHSLELFTPLAEDPTMPIELDLDDVERFLEEAPPVLDELGVVLLGPEQLIRTRPTIRGSASPKESEGSGRFSASALMDWKPVVDGSEIDAAQLERALASGSSLLHVNGRWVRLDRHQIRATLERLRAHEEDHAELDVAALLRLAAATVETETHVHGDQWIEDLLAGLPDERLVETHEPDSFAGELRHYQRRGLSWMAFLSRLGLGGILADDMGLGKTATTLAHLATRSGPHLVVCPLSVVHNWEAEAARFTPELSVEIHHGGERARGVDVVELRRADVVVTTYGLLTRDVDALSTVRWETVVLDEAQAIKNQLTRAAKAVRRLTAQQKLALTGTPVENHLGELWAILDAVNPGLYGSATAFSETYTKPIQRKGDAAAAIALRTLTQPFVLRRTKADKTLLPELPDKIEKTAYASLTREQATMYQGVVDDLLANAQAATGMRRRGLVLAALTRLKQICNHPAHALGDRSRIEGRSGKLTRFDELVDELLEVEERAIVFTQFREMGLILQQHLRERLGMDAPFLHGGVSRTGRQKMVTTFQDGDGAPLLLVSLKAGGTGLNLTAASQVIHYDRWWNPAVEDQATDRAWRLGQSKTVVVHKLVCEGTLEERIAELIDSKRALAATVLGTGEHWLTELTTDELRSLVALAPGATR